MAVRFPWRKNTDDSEVSVNGSYNDGLAFASHSVCFQKHACTIEILPIKCWQHVMCATAISTCISAHTVWGLVSISISMSIAASIFIFLSLSFQIILNICIFST